MTTLGAHPSGRRLRIVPAGRLDGGTHDEIASLRQEVARLQSENKYLRDAAQAFGELAERLNQQLRDRAERR